MKLLFTSLFFLCHFVVFGQGKQIFKEGDTLANYQVRMVANGEIVNTRDLIGKRNLILYFWGRRCLPCVRNLPKLDSIQKRFGDKIFILCVSADKDIKEVKEFLDLRPRLSRASLTFVTDGSLKIFRGFKGSNVCWFDRDAILRVIALPETTTKDNIEHWLKGRNYLSENK